MKVEIVVRVDGEEKIGVAYELSDVYARFATMSDHMVAENVVDMAWSKLCAAAISAVAEGVGEVRASVK